MKKSESETNSTRWSSRNFVAKDGYQISCRYYPATGKKRGTIACLHGIQSHAGWYELSCTFLADAGFDVYFMDRRGSGENQFDRGHCSHRKQLTDDVVEFLQFVRQQSPALPVVLIGISWGGKLAVAAVQGRKELADAIALIGPGMFPKVSPTIHEKLAIGWSAFLWPRRKINIPLSDPSLFTANPLRQEYIRRDELSLRKATARMLLCSKLLDGDIRRAPENITIPSLLVLADKDRIIDNGPTRKYFERFASQHREVLFLEDVHHTIEFEPDPLPIFGKLLAAIERLPIFGTQK